MKSAPKPHPRDFEALVSKFWSAEKLRKVTGGKRYKVLPTTAPHLLRHLGLLNADASMSSDSVRKFSQVNHLLTLLEPVISEATKDIKIPVIVEAGCGKSYLSLVLMWAFDHLWRRPAFFVGIDSNVRTVEASRTSAAAIGTRCHYEFLNTDLQSGWWGMVEAEAARATGIPVAKCRPHVLLALHACDTATDYAIAAGILHHADVIACAPCCQAELAAKWRALADSEPNPMRPLYRAAELRRDIAADMTDLLRVLLLRSRGYEVTTTEFIKSEHTPKNRLITGKRRGRFLESARQEYEALRNSFGGAGIRLEELL